MSSKLDNMIERWMPGLAMRREVQRHNLRVVRDSIYPYGSGSPAYNGGTSSRRRAQITQSTEREDTGVASDYHDLIAAAMNLYRNDPITRSIVDTTTSYMGESKPQASTTDPEWNRLASEYFMESFWGAADARRRPGVDFGAMQQQWSNYCWFGGDMLFALWDRSLLPYEGLQIRTPNKLRTDGQIVNGVRVEKAPPWKITHYYVCNSLQRKYNETQEDFTRIRHSEGIFCPSKAWRPAMLRGVPELHAVIDALQDFGETSDNVQNRVKFESMVMTLECKGALGNIPGARLLNQDSSKGTQVEYSKADYGMRFKINGDPDKDFKFAQMTNPHSEYVSYMEWMARIISAGCGIPYEIVMHVYTSGSYTANRAARLDFARFVRDRWAWRNKVLNQRVWNWTIAQAIKRGDIPPAPADDRGISQWYKCAWTLPHFPHIDEGKEVLADINQWGCGQESLSDWAQQRGMSRDQLLEAHDADVAAMQERAEKLGLSLDMYMGKLFTASAAKDKEPAPVVEE